MCLKLGPRRYVNQSLSTSLMVCHLWPGHNAFPLPAALLPVPSLPFTPSQPELPVPVAMAFCKSTLISPPSPAIVSTYSTEVLKCVARPLTLDRSPSSRSVRSSSSDGGSVVRMCATNPERRWHQARPGSKVDSAAPAMSETDVKDTGFSPLPITLTLPPFG